MSMENKNILLIQLHIHCLRQFPKHREDSLGKLPSYLSARERYGHGRGGGQRLGAASAGISRRFAGSGASAWFVVAGGDPAVGLAS